MDENGLGFPLGNATKFSNVKYQEFTLGVIYQVDGSDSYVCVKGADYAALSEKYDSVEEALVGEGIATDPEPDEPETEPAETGTYKAMAYAVSDDGSVKFWYDGEENAFTLSGTPAYGMDGRKF